MTRPLQLQLGHLQPICIYIGCKSNSIYFGVTHYDGYCKLTMLIVATRGVCKDELQ
jgi:hypothetical protein